MRGGWTFKNSNKLRGAYGETDYDKKLVRVNKRRHKSKTAKRITPNKDGSENLLTTIAHEMVHVNHPRRTEKSTEKLARAMVSKMGKKQKGRLYSKFH